MNEDLRPGGFSAVVPYYNEAAYLPAILTSLLAQTRPLDRLILVDNGSTDESETICRRLLRDGPVKDVVFLHDPRPGHVNALETGCRAVDTEFVAFCDADTRYPPHYVAFCSRLFQEASPDVVALMALPVYGDPDRPGSRWPRRARVALSKLLRKQALTGAYGHVLRTTALRAAGGYSCARWSLLRADHELMHRVFRHGVPRYHVDLWCWASARRRNRPATRWNLMERLLYHFTPYHLKDWYFYRFLAPRFERRGMSQLNLRHQTWHEGSSSS